MRKMLFWDTPIKTGNEITSNTPGIAGKGKNDIMCLLNDMSVPRRKPYLHEN